MCVWALRRQLNLNVTPGYTSGKPHTHRVPWVRQLCSLVCDSWSPADLSCAGPLLITWQREVKTRVRWDSAAPTIIQSARDTQALAFNHSLQHPPLQCVYQMPHTQFLTSTVSHNEMASVSILKIKWIFKREMDPEWQKQKERIMFPKGEVGVGERGNMGKKGELEVKKENIWRRKIG